MITRSLLIGLACLASAAHAETTGTRGTVEEASSRWTASGDLIVTDVVVEASDGTRVTLTVPGGSVDGLGMSVSHHDASFRPGDAVTLVRQGNAVRATRLTGAHRIAPHAGEPTVGVQRTSRSGRALFHTSGCLDFVYDAAGTRRVNGDAEWKAVDEALGAWETASGDLECGGVQFQRRIESNAPDGRDGINTVRFRDELWCRPASGGTPEVCHSPEAVGVTRVLYIDDPFSPRDGEIVEVDIELNGVDFDLATDGRATAIDVASAVAHEVGHALGLDHNCGIENGAWPTGLDGNLVASCESLPADLGAATMYFQVAPGTTTMRTPQSSDVDGLCEIVQGLCAVDVAGGCSTSGSSAAPLLGSLLAGLLAFRRRRNARARAPVCGR